MLLLPKVLTIIAYSTMFVAGRGITYLRYDTYTGRYDFFLASNVIGFLVTMVTFLVYLLSLEGVLGTKTIWNHLNFVFCVLLAFFCCMSAGLMIVFAENEFKSFYYTTDFPDYLTWRLYTKLRLAAIVCGFLSSLIFLIDAIFQLIEIRSLSSSEPTNSSPCGIPPESSSRITHAHVDENSENKGSAKVSVQGSKVNEAK